MPSHKSISGRTRLVTALVLAAAAVPTVQAWRQSLQSVPNSAPFMTNNVSVSAADNLAQWTLPNTLELQLKSDSNADTLVELSRKIGATVTYNSDLGQETEIARVTLPDGVNVQSVLDTLRDDPNVEAADLVHLYRTPEDLSEPIRSCRP